MFKVKVVNSPVSSKTQLSDLLPGTWAICGHGLAYRFTEERERLYNMTFGGIYISLASGDSWLINHDAVLGEFQVVDSINMDVVVKI